MEIVLLDHLADDSAGTEARKRFSLASALQVSVSLSSLSAVIFSLQQRSTSVFLCYVLFGCIGWLAASRIDRTSTRIFTTVYGFGAIAAIVLYLSYLNNYGVPYLMGGSDDLNYERIGQEIGQQLGIFDYGSIRGDIVTPWFNSVGYIYLVSLLWRLSELLGGFHTMVPRLFNVLCLGWLSVGIYRLSLRVALSKRMAVSAGLFVGLLPLMAYTAVHTYRDIFVAMVLVWLTVLWSPTEGPLRRRVLLANLLVSFAVCAILFEFRKGQAFVAIAVVLTGLFFRMAVPTRRAKVILVVGCSVIMASLLLSLKYVNTELLGFLAQADQYSEYRTEISGGLSSIIFSAPMPLGAVLRVAYALVSPLPVPSTMLYEQWVSLGTLIHFFFIPYLLAGIAVSLRNRDRAVLLVAFLLLFCGMAFFTFGIRHIVQYLPFAVVLAAIGYERYRSFRYRICLCEGCFGMMLLIAYLVIKS